MNSRRTAAILGAFGVLTAPYLNSFDGRGRVHVKPVERTRMKGLSSEEMDTKGNGKKLSRAQRKAKARKRK